MRNIIETGTSLMGNDYEWRLVKVRPVVAEEEAGGLETTEEEEEEEEEDDEEYESDVGSELSEESYIDSD